MRASSRAHTGQCRANAVIYACEHPIRDAYPGGVGWVQMRLANLIPALGDWQMVRKAYKDEQTLKPRPHRGPPDNLYGPAADLEESSGFGAFSYSRDPIGQALLHPWVTFGALAGVGLAVAGVAGRRWQNG